MNDFASSVAHFDDDHGLARMSLSGRSLLAHVSGALYWPDENALIVSDLSLDLGPAEGLAGSFRAPRDRHRILGQLSRVVCQFEPKTVISLGTAFRRPTERARLAQADIDLLRELQSGRHWFWVPPSPDPIEESDLGGDVVAEVQLGGLRFQGVPFAGPAIHEIAGGLHPAARINVRGHDLKRPCFVSNGRRMVLPAFASFGGGNNVLEHAFRPVFGNDGLFVWMLGQEGIWPVAARQLEPDDLAA